MTETAKPTSTPPDSDLQKLSKLSRRTNNAGVVETKLNLIETILDEAINDLKVELAKPDIDNSQIQVFLSDVNLIKAGFEEGFTKKGSDPRIRDQKYAKISDEDLTSIVARFTEAAKEMLARTEGKKAVAVELKNLEINKPQKSGAKTKEKPEPEQPKEGERSPADLDAEATKKEQERFEQMKIRMRAGALAIEELLRDPIFGTNPTDVEKNLIRLSGGKQNAYKSCVEAKGIFFEISRGKKGMDLNAKDPEDCEDFINFLKDLKKRREDEIGVDKKRVTSLAPLFMEVDAFLSRHDIGEYLELNKIDELTTAREELERDALDMTKEDATVQVAKDKVTVLLGALGEEYKKKNLSSFALATEARDKLLPRIDEYIEIKGGASGIESFDTVEKMQELMDSAVSDSNNHKVKQGTSAYLLLKIDDVPNFGPVERLNILGRDFNGGLAVQDRSSLIRYIISQKLRLHFSEKQKKVVEDKAESIKTSAVRFAKLRSWIAKKEVVERIRGSARGASMGLTRGIYEKALDKGYGRTVKLFDKIGALIEGNEMRNARLLQVRLNLAERHANNITKSAQIYNKFYTNLDNLDAGDKAAFTGVFTAVAAMGIVLGGPQLAMVGLSKSTWAGFGAYSFLQAAIPATIRGKSMWTKNVFNGEKRGRLKAVKSAVGQFAVSLLMGRFVAPVIAEVYQASFESFYDTLSDTFGWYKNSASSIDINDPKLAVGVGIMRHAGLSDNDISEAIKTKGKSLTSIAGIETVAFSYMSQTSGLMNNVNDPVVELETPAAKKERGIVARIGGLWRKGVDAVGEAKDIVQEKTGFGKKSVEVAEKPVGVPLTPEATAADKFKTFRLNDRTDIERATNVSPKDVAKMNGEIKRVDPNYFSYFKSNVFSGLNDVHFTAMTKDQWGVAVESGALEVANRPYLAYAKLSKETLQIMLDHIKKSPELQKDFFNDKAFFAKMIQNSQMATVDQTRFIAANFKVDASGKLTPKVLSETTAAPAVKLKRSGAVDPGPKPVAEVPTSKGNPNVGKQTSQDLPDNSQKAPSELKATITPVEITKGNFMQQLARLKNYDGNIENAKVIVGSWKPEHIAALGASEAKDIDPRYVSLFTKTQKLALSREAIENFKPELWNIVKLSDFDLFRFSNTGMSLIRDVKLSRQSLFNVFHNLDKLDLRSLDTNFKQTNAVMSFRPTQAALDALLKNYLGEGGEGKTQGMTDRSINSLLTSTDKNPGFRIQNGKAVPNWEMPINTNLSTPRFKIGPDQINSLMMNTSRLTIEKKLSFLTDASTKGSIDDGILHNIDERNMSEMLGKLNGDVGQMFKLDHTPERLDGIFLDAEAKLKPIFKLGPDQLKIIAELNDRGIWVKHDFQFRELEAARARPFWSPTSAKASTGFPVQGTPKNPDPNTTSPSIVPPAPPEVAEPVPNLKPRTGPAAALKPSVVAPVQAQVDVPKPIDPQGVPSILRPTVKLNPVDTPNMVSRPFVPTENNPMPGVVVDGTKERSSVFTEPLQNRRVQTIEIPKAVPQAPVSIPSYPEVTTTQPNISTNLSFSEQLLKTEISNTKVDLSGEKGAEGAIMDYLEDYGKKTGLRLSEKQINTAARNVTMTRPFEFLKVVEEQALVEGEPINSEFKKMLAALKTGKKIDEDVLNRFYARNIPNVTLKGAQIQKLLEQQITSSASGTKVTSSMRSFLGDTSKVGKTFSQLVSESPIKVGTNSDAKLDTTKEMGETRASKREGSSDITTEPIQRQVGKPFNLVEAESGSKVVLRGSSYERANGKDMGFYQSGKVNLNLNLEIEKNGSKAEIILSEGLKFKAALSGLFDGLYYVSDRFTVLTPNGGQNPAEAIKLHWTTLSANQRMKFIDLVEEAIKAKISASNRSENDKGLVVKAISELFGIKSPKVFDLSTQNVTTRLFKPSDQNFAKVFSGIDLAKLFTKVKTN